MSKDATPIVSDPNKVYSFPLPPGARARIRYNGCTFFINSVPPGREPQHKAQWDRPFWLYSGASTATLGGLLMLSMLMPSDSSDLMLDDLMASNRFVGYLEQPDELPPEPEQPDEAQTEEEAGGQGKREAGPEGKMGDPKERKPKGIYSMKGPKDAIQQIARNFDPELAAREAGILGVMQTETGHFIASISGSAFAVGADDEDIWGGFTGTEIGAANGNAGLGLIGTGRRGGGTGEGTVGLGGVGTIGKGGGGGPGTGYGHGKGSGFGKRGPRKPVVRAARSSLRGAAMDKDVIRRVIRNHINEVRHCYNQGLARDPNLKGRVTVQFSIGPSGRVPVAVVQQSSLGERNVGNCVAAAVRRWRFPRPPGGGTAIVTYPFVMSPGS